MKTKQLATKIDSSVKEALEAVCEERGIKMNRFIEDAILDKLEEMEDVEDLKIIRRENYRPFAEVLKELKKNGKI
jgi:antitoxin component of RelBE/YafQ-DinJ toxin-antitoxin module